MIGHAYPVADTGYSVLEEGQLNPSTLSLEVTAYRIATPRGDLLEASYSSLDEAILAAQCLVSEQSSAEAVKNVI